MGFTPQKPVKKEQIKNDLGIKCPFRFFMESEGFSSDCIQNFCGLWMPIQKACSLNVMARMYKNVNNP